MNEGMRMARNLDRYRLGSGTRGAPVAAIARGPDRQVYSTARPVYSGTRELPPTEEAKERAENIAVALKQPHRLGSDDNRLGTALGRFLAAQRNAGIADYGWHAGQRYAEIIKQSRTALGLYVHGWAPSDGAFVELDEDQIRAQKESSKKKLQDAEAILRKVMPRLPSAMARLVYDEIDPFPGDGGILVHGLINLAIEWGFLKMRPDVA